MRRLSPLTRYRLRIVLMITLIWVLLGIMIETNNALAYNPVSGRYFAYFPFGNGMIQHLLITAMGPLLGGLFGGYLILFVLRDLLRRRSFANKLIVQSTIFLGLIFVLVMVVGSIQAITIGADFTETFVDVVFTWRVLRLMITWFTVVIFTLLLLDVSEKYGQGVLWKIVTGKYHQPVTEARIFMFMDLTNSTGLAESLGDEKYFRLLRSVFYVATEPVLNSEGEIYQYVGDELVLSWTVKDGLRNANCLECFFRINNEIEKQRLDFIQQFGVVPAFKAAVHMGNVVIGEIGVIKKDIVYAGDVLNSTSRIVNLSKQYGEPLLISDIVYDKLKDDHRFMFQFLDALVLRGKTIETKVYSVKILNS